MKLATILVPAYLPRAYAGATPAPYQSSTVDTFERKLAAMSPFVVRTANVTRIRPDTIAGRFVHQEILMRYDILVDPETTTLAEAAALALKEFGIEKVAVIFDDADAEDIGAGEIEALTDGLHPWTAPDHE